MITANNKRSVTFVENAQITGESTDEKPMNAGVNSLFLELDTGDFYYFNGTEWKLVGWNA